MKIFKIIVCLMLVIAVNSCSKAKRFAVTTKQPENIKATSATLVGSFESKGKSTSVKEQGFCYSADRVPTYDDTRVMRSGAFTDGISLGITDLKPNTFYVVRAYSKLDNADIIYGNAIEFSTNGEYVYGDTGPAGGFIFNVYEGNTHGKYSEAYSFDSVKVEWGCTNVTSTGTGVGLAVVNTDRILQNCPGNSAAKKCLEYSINGYADWYLASADELVTMRTGGYKTNKTHPFKSTVYWSSTDAWIDPGYAYCFDFSASVDHYGSVEKSNKFQLIAVRYFN